MGKLNKIQVPTFFLSVLDDPIINENLYPFKEFEANPNILGGFTKRGGHCGHFSGGLKPYQWFPQPLVEFFDFIEKKKN